MRNPHTPYPADEEGEQTPRVFTGVLPGQRSPADVPVIDEATTEVPVIKPTTDEEVAAAAPGSADQRETGVDEADDPPTALAADTATTGTHPADAEPAGTEPAGTGPTTSTEPTTSDEQTEMEADVVVDMERMVAADQLVAAQQPAGPVAADLGDGAAEPVAADLGDRAAEPVAADLGDRAAEPIETAAPLRPGDVTETPISIWSDEAAQRLRDQWREVQVRFIDDPDAAVAEAKSLVTDAVHTMSDTLLAEQEEFDPRRDSDNPDTEAMRVAMRRYREFLDRVLAL